MDPDRSERYNIIVGILCFGAFILLFLMLRSGFQSADPTIKLPSLVITGVMALFASLALVAVVFSVAGLSDETQALGLPEGSVRAAIALSLIVVFAIIVIYFYSSMRDVKDAADPQKLASSVDFAKQAFAVVGTLVTSVASFYFATRAATPTAAAALPTPSLTNIVPATAVRTAGATVPVKISGTGLQLAKTVNLEMGASKVQGTNVLSNDVLVTCDLTLDPSLPAGKYDVIVTTADGATAKLPSAFALT